LNGYISTASSTVSGDFYAGGNVSASSSLTVAGPATFNSAVAAGSTLNVTGLTTLAGAYIAVGSSTVTGSFYTGGAFNASSTAQVAGTFTTYGATVLGDGTGCDTVTIYGNVLPGTTATYDIGSTSTQFRYGNFNGGIQVGTASASSTLSPASLQIGIVTANQGGVFSVDASGNTSASGTLRVFGNTTLSGTASVDLPQ
jgi:hypothetical protein